MTSCDFKPVNVCRVNPSGRQWRGLDMTSCTLPKDSRPPSMQWYRQMTKRMHIKCMQKENLNFFQHSQYEYSFSFKSGLQLSHAKCSAAFYALTLFVSLSVNYLQHMGGRTKNCLWRLLLAAPTSLCEQGKACLHPWPAGCRRSLWKYMASFDILKLHLNPGHCERNYNVCLWSKCPGLNLLALASEVFFGGGPKIAVILSGLESFSWSEDVYTPPQMFAHPLQSSPCQLPQQPLQHHQFSSRFVLPCSVWGKASKTRCILRNI